MTDNDMKKLKDSETPTPRTSARKAAIAEALAAFDAVGAQKDGAQSKVDEHTNEELLTWTKGPAVYRRLPNVSSQQKRRRPMRLVNKYAIAASIVAATVAVPAVFYTLRENKPVRVSGLSSLDLNRQTGAEQQAGARLPAVVDSNGRPVVVAGKVDSSKVEQRAGGPNEPATLVAPRPASETEVAAKKAAEGSPARQQPVPAAASTARGKDGRASPDARVRTLSAPADGLGASAGNSGYGGTLGLTDRVARNGPKAQVAAMPEKKRRPASREMSAGLGAVATLRSPDHVAVERDQYRDRFESVAPNTIKQVASEPVSTFSIDVDTASYSFVRRALNGGRLPPRNSVRVEELINYFPYGYEAPASAEVPFKVKVGVVPPPWSRVNRLVHIAIKGYELAAAERPRANLVFLVDVSGSMSSRDKLPLVQNALRMLVNELRPEDTIGIVTYASGSGVALEPTSVKDKVKILAVIESLSAGGSTAGAQGIQDAYRLAEGNFDAESVNRIILATDGDFNVGITNQDELKGYIERKRKAGIFLSILGVGQGNYNDALMQVLAQNGNGTASYIDTLNEARKVLVDEASSTLFTIAKDVKIQVEFNPARVKSYRLIGYETRALNREDFNNDRVDAGDVGSGHFVTAIYEITPVGAPGLVDDLRYGQAATATENVPVDANSEIGFLKLRYKLPNEDTSRLLSHPIAEAAEKPNLDSASSDVRFAIAVAAFGQLLRGETHLGDYGYDDVVELARGAKGDDPFGYRAEFINLVRLAKSARP